MYGFYDVSGKFNQTDANSPNAQLYNYGPKKQLPTKPRGLEPSFSGIKGCRPVQQLQRLEQLKVQQHNKRLLIKIKP
jgi:hypothetical protein